MEAEHDLQMYSDRGNEIFDRVIAVVAADRTPEDFVAIDIESEDFEIAESQHSAWKELITRRPGAKVYFRRVGSRIGHRIGTSQRDSHPSRKV